MELVHEETPILYQEMEDFDFENPPTDPRQLESDMIDFMIEHRGVGLSANQLGLPYRVFVFGNPDDRESCKAIFNPKIIHRNGGLIKGEEGCLSFPGLNLTIKRDEEVRVRFRTSDGVADTLKFTGYTSRIVQHEIDHLNGIPFTKRAKNFHLNRALKKRKIWQRRQNS